MKHHSCTVLGSRCNRDVPHSVRWSILQQQLAPLTVHHADFNNDSLVTSAKCAHEEKGEFLQAIYDAEPNGWV